MSRPSLSLLTLALLAMAGCGGESPTSTAPTYADLSGSFDGPIRSAIEGFPVDVTLSLTVNQVADSVSGTFGLSGTVGSGNEGATVNWSGAFTGTVTTGENPSINLMISRADCPNQAAHWSGSYSSANHALTITGPVSIWNLDSCSTAFSFQTTVVLKR